METEDRSWSMVVVYTITAVVVELMMTIHFYGCSQSLCSVLSILFTSESNAEAQSLVRKPEIQGRVHVGYLDHLDMILN